MIKPKAVIAGLLATIILGMVNQLLFVLAAAAIGNAHDSYGFFSAYKNELWFVCGMTMYCLTMAAGGAVTALFARTHVALNAALVGTWASITSLAASVGEDEFTAMSILLVVLGMASASIGGMVWERWSASNPGNSVQLGEPNPEHR